jgi:hypothetical protein
MKKIFLYLITAMVCLAYTGCKYDDSDLWNEVDGIKDRVEALEQATTSLNNDLSALSAIVNTLKTNVTITAVNQNAAGYEIKFSDGTVANISHGKDGADGADGVSCPQISVSLDTDGNYYWTLDGEWLIVDGQKVRANGIDGADGADGADGVVTGVAPMVRINPDNNEWEISTDGGKTWSATGVTALGQAGDSLFQRVDTSNAGYVLFVLADGTEFKVSKFDANDPMLVIEGIEGFQKIPYGTTKTYTVTSTNIAQYSIQKPDGWKVTFDGSKLSVTAPVKENTFAEPIGTISVIVVSTNNKSLIVKFEVGVYELRVLTFEDADAKFSPFKLNYCNKTISTWSDLIDDKQYGGILLYGSGGGMDEPYKWYDQGNTELRHTMPASWGTYCYWGGGHAISNYYDTDQSNGDMMHQLSVFGTGAHNGSANCAVHYGYRDNSGFTDQSVLCALEFGDGVERIIDHMWMMNTTYAINCYIDGNGLTDKIGPDDWVKVVAYGYDKSGAKTGEAEIYLCNGPDNIVTDWTKWDLTKLGKVAKVEFNILGSSDNGYGFSQPAYFAYDDVAVRF